jgi:hypothetical protein
MVCFIPWLVLYLEIDSKGSIKMKLYDRRDYFNFPIVKFRSICSNIAVIVSICISIDKVHQILWFISCFPWLMIAANKEATELWVSRVTLNFSFPIQCFTIAIMAWFTVTEYRCYRKHRICYVRRSYNAILLFSLMIHHRIFRKCNTTVATSGAGTTNPSGSPVVTVFDW